MAENKWVSNWGEISPRNIWSYGPLLINWVGPLHSNSGIFAGLVRDLQT